MTYTQKLAIVERQLAMLPLPEDCHVNIGLGDKLEIDVHGCGVEGLSEARDAFTANGEEVEPFTDEYRNLQSFITQVDDVEVTYYL